MRAHHWEYAMPSEVRSPRLAVLIDADNTSAKIADGLFEEVAKIGEASVRRIYGDFSGYSDMAIGAARILGFKLMKNFNRPYHSKTIQEFWSRWHISLSTWFRDYLYISLGGNRVSIPRWYFNLFFVFLVSGLWHGANWTFVMWGALHGFYLVFALVTKNTRAKINEALGLTKVPKLLALLQTLITFFLAAMAWVFFRAKTISDAFYIIKYSFVGFGESIHKFLHHQLNLHEGMRGFDFRLGILAILLMETLHILQNKVNLTQWLMSRPILVRWSIYYGAVLLILWFGVYENKKFIYFQF